MWGGGIAVAKPRDPGVDLVQAKVARVLDSTFRLRHTLPR